MSKSLAISDILKDVFIKDTSIISHENFYLVTETITKEQLRYSYNLRVVVGILKESA